MPLREGRAGGGAGSHLWMLLCLLPWCLLPVGGSTPSPGGLPTIVATPPEEERLSTAVQLQPDLETEAQTPTEAPTEEPTEVPTEEPTEEPTEVPTEVPTEEPPKAQTEVPTEEPTEVQTQVITRNYTGLSCVPVLPPRRGSFYVESGTGVSIGSVLTFWCREGFQLVGSDKISCEARNGKAQWSNYLPVCEAIPRPEDHGLRVAVLASVVSGIVIFAMSLSFLICCLQERSGRDRSKKDGRSRRREKRSARHSECWLEREEGEWEAFPPPKIFHLSQRMNPRLAPDSPLYLTGALNGYENRGYQRSLQIPCSKADMTDIQPV
ncbi:uncharacterized protein ACNS7B_001713 isoform 2-T2 [Menidia menidia]